MAVAALLGALVAVMPGSPAQAQSCYGGAVRWLSSSTQELVTLPGTQSHWTTTSRCQDINFKVTSDASLHADVRVCFVSAGYCQANWKRFDADDVDVWRVIASDVLDGTTFRIQIDYYFVPNPGQRNSGWIAF